jgi:hypothetical protein
MLDITAASCAHTPVHIYADWTPKFDPMNVLPDPLADLKNDTVIYTPMSDPVDTSAPPVIDNADFTLTPAQASVYRRRIMHTNTPALSSNQAQ